MGQKQCGKCGEMVDEAKAFCPSCGEPFVAEEKRTDTSKYSEMDHTVKLGDSMYNQMLSDMGLNLAKPDAQKAKRIEVVQPIAPAPAPKPAAPFQNPVPAHTKRNAWLWVAAAAALLVLVMLAAAVAYYLLLRQQI